MLMWNPIFTDTKLDADQRSKDEDIFIGEIEYVPLPNNMPKEKIKIQVVGQKEIA